MSNCQNKIRRKYIVAFMGMVGLRPRESIRNFWSHEASFSELFSVLLWNYVFLHEQMLYSCIYHKLYNGTCSCPILRTALYGRISCTKMFAIFQNSSSQKQQVRPFHSVMLLMFVFFFLAYVFFVVKGMNPSQRKDWISITGNTALC